MSKDLDKWYLDFLDKNQRPPTFIEGFQAQQPEIDALKRVIEVRRGIARHLSADVERLSNENATLKAEAAQRKHSECAAWAKVVVLNSDLKQLKAENERLRADVERYKKLWEGAA